MDKSNVPRSHWSARSRVRPRAKRWKITHSRRWTLKRINVAAEDRGRSAMVEVAPGIRSNCRWRAGASGSGALGSFMEPSVRVGRLWVKGEI